MTFRAWALTLTGVGVGRVTGVMGAPESHAAVRQPGFDLPDGTVGSRRGWLVRRAARLGGRAGWLGVAAAGYLIRTPQYARAWSRKSRGCRARRTLPSHSASGRDPDVVAIGIDEAEVGLPPGPDGQGLDPPAVRHGPHPASTSSTSTTISTPRRGARRSGRDGNDAPRAERRDAGVRCASVPRSPARIRRDRTLQGAAGPGQQRRRPTTAQHRPRRARTAGRPESSIALPSLPAPARACCSQPRSDDHEQDPGQSVSPQP
jgi:hypothetical protein